jgi:hypothetical protein
MATKSEPTVLAVAPSKTNPSKSYEIRRGKDGVIYCTCPAWRYQRLKKGETRTCKHLAAFFARELSAAEPAAAVTKSEVASGLSNHKRRWALRTKRNEEHKAAQ